MELTAVVEKDGSHLGFSIYHKGPSSVRWQHGSQASRHTLTAGSDGRPRRTWLGPDGDTVGAWCGRRMHRYGRTTAGGDLEQRNAILELESALD